MQTITTIGLDLAKSVFQIHAINQAGEVLVRRALRRSQVLDFFRKQPPCLVGLEACASAHFWAREIAALGHDVRMIPQFMSRLTSSAARQMRPMPKQSAKP